MSLPAYAEYKDSGVEWLGDVPKSWVVAKLSRLVVRVLTGTTPSITEVSGLLDEGIDWYTPSDFKDDILLGDSKKQTPLNLISGENLTVFPENSVLVIGIGATLGKIGLTQKISTSNQQINAILPNEKINSKFLAYSLLVKIEQMRVLSNASTIGIMNQEKTKQILLVVPSIEEQTTITRFLDHETAKIDALIAEQQRLIELLKEKRQAVISHAVTKGLDPNAPMKDSGVAWLGDVPEHWKVVSSKFLYEFVTSGSRGWADFYADEGDLFFRIANLTRDTIEPKMESIQFVNAPSGAEGERSKIRKGDLLISITADLGSVCVADDQITGGYVSQHVALTRPNSKVKCSRWFAYAILSNASKEQLIGYGYGGTKVQLSLEDIKSICMVLPSESDQLAISEYLDAFIHNVNCLMTEAEHTVSLLKERRSALISAAVTGKIDVRGWQPPATAVTIPQGQQQILFED